MRSVSLIAVLQFFVFPALLILPASSHAKPLHELLAEGSSPESTPAKLSYNHGALLDFGSSTLRSNIGLQTLYTYTDYDGTAEDSSSFEARNARLELEGTALNGEFSWVVSNDFGSTNTDSRASGSELQDAFIKWNWCDPQSLIAGQFKTFNNRSWNIHYANQQFIDRSLAADAFTLGRQAGVAYVGQLGPKGGHSLGIFNGNSVVEGRAEGQNLPGRDNRVLAVYAIDLSLIGDYDRSYEGDPMNSSELAFGVGGSGYFGKAELSSDDFQTDADEFGGSVDAGVRVGGLSAQAEVYYGGGKLSPRVAGQRAFDNFGMYAQTGYFIVPSEWEVAGRFGWISFDDSASDVFYDGIEDQYEVNAVLTYYINGHHLKFMTGPSWVLTKTADDSEDITDFRYQAGFFGYF